MVTHRRVGTSLKNDYQIDSSDNDDDDSSAELDDTLNELDVTWCTDITIYRRETVRPNVYPDRNVTRDAKFFLLKLLMVPLSAYIITLFVWLYQINFTSRIFIYKTDTDQNVVQVNYSPVR